MIADQLRVSLAAALLATLVVTVLGVTVGYALAKTRWRGRRVLEALLSAPVALPPTVVGYYLLTQLGGPGPVRDASVAVFGHPLTFTFTGVVVAQCVESFPYALRSTRAAVAGVDPRAEQVARTTGLPERRVAVQVTLPLAARGIAVGVALAFGRALGDYGATSAISGRSLSTTTMSLGLGDALDGTGAADVRTLALVQVALAVAVMLLVSTLTRRRSAPRPRKALA